MVRRNSSAGSICIEAVGFASRDKRLRALGASKRVEEVASKQNEKNHERLG